MNLTSRVLKLLLPVLLPGALAWARSHEKKILKAGRSLTPSEDADARKAGVQNSEEIRISLVGRIPRPESGLLGWAGRKLRLITDDTGGLTLNYGIYLRSDCERNRRLVAHEFGHVAQYERMNGFAGFLAVYLLECIKFGYPNTPMENEVESRAQEIIRTSSEIP